ncbi:hypothetical protein L226DRAFT_557239 [Lentinus tigrinus ALCF2SS1-7]|uniref:Uncharacterized protein n=1 Tax=Lentinus tigrinus ALCF2SS1-6 TaxID=1328759 RepID=A0A5C2SSB5_9APHY|nr:hypothetical protein L227DRAFT_597335 [Lentinus tigrinus ALCF2SS1-6]RPD79897.1 hypothetical protein L226DRAFT_557239 [Lentinus tigrinus ALCF2SS1-7]
MDAIKRDDQLSLSDLESTAPDVKMGDHSSSTILMDQGLELSAKHDDTKNPELGPTMATRTASPPIVRLTEFGRRMQRRAQEKFEETYPHILDRLKRFLTLCGLTFMIIFIVMLASFVMALSHWFTVVFGHIFLRYSVPLSIDDAFDKTRLDNTMIFAVVGAFIVNLLPFITFVLSIPFTFDRTVLEGSAAPANEFIKRITPKNRYMLLLMKYAPRLLAGPVGCKIFWILDSDVPDDNTLDPLHAFMAGAAGEVVLTMMGLIKNALGKRKDAGDSSTAGSGTLPM